jgi:hypothetical protein
MIFDFYALDLKGKYGRSLLPINIKLLQGILGNTSESGNSWNSALAMEMYFFWAIQLGET